MTLIELASILDINEDTLKNQFPRTRDRLKKKGILITKVGRGESAQYDYEFIAEDDGRAITLFDETKTEIVCFDKKFIGLPELQFYAFLAVASTPNNMFHGSYNDFLEYIGYSQNKENREKLISAFKALDENNVLMFSKDKTNDDYFFVGIYKKVEDEAHVGIEMMKRCKKIIEKYSIDNKRYNFISLAKVYIGAQTLHKTQPYTFNDFCKLTGLSESTIRKYEELLVRENVCLVNKVYYKDFVEGRSFCVGKENTFNAF